MLETETVDGLRGGEKDINCEVNMAEDGSVRVVRSWRTTVTGRADRRRQTSTVCWVGVIDVCGGVFAKLVRDIYT